MIAWKQALAQYHTYLLLEGGYAPNTIEAYIRDVTRLQVFAMEEHQLESPAQVSREHLQWYMGWLYDLGLGYRTQARILSSLRSFFAYLFVNEDIAQDPGEHIDSPKMGRHIPEVLSFEEIQTMLQAIDLSTPHGLRNRAMLETLYASGLRVSELIELRLSNLYFDEGFVRITGKGRKERLVPIGQEAIKHIGFYISGVRNHYDQIPEAHSDYVFLSKQKKKLSRIMVFMVVKEVAELVGIEKNVSPHTFRHSFATHLVEGGASLRAVQEMLGHESITTTEIYTHLDLNYLRQTIVQYHPRGK